MNTFENILYEEIEKEISDVEIQNINESIFTLNPFLAFFLLKDKEVESNNVVKKKSIKSKIKDKGRKAKAKAHIGKEKIKASLGLKSGAGEDATVYKFTDEQKEFLKELYDKYGQELIEDILKFRKEILAPYQLIKRIIKQNRTVSSKDKYGMTHAQFKQAVESGKKKIEKRNTFFDDSGASQEKIDKLSQSIENLKKARKDLDNTGELKNSYVEKVLKNYELDSESFKNQSLDDLRKTYDEIQKNYLEMEKSKSPEKKSDLIKRNLDLRKGAITKEKQESSKEQQLSTDNPKFKNNDGSFNAALGKYFLRREVINKISNDNSSIFRKLYLEILDEMIKKALNRRKELVNKKFGDKSKIEFNEIERKIWKPKDEVGKQYSGDINDYNQIIKDEDFGDVEYIERPKELIEAEKEIEKEIKRFERNLKKTVSSDDFEKIKNKKLINNLITVKELKKANELFKSPEDVKNQTTKKETTKEEEE